MNLEEKIRTIIVGLLLLVLLVFFIKKKQCKKTNWSLFYSFIWVLFSLPIVNYYFTELGFWSFNEKNIIKIPFDILFIWMFFWVLPFYLFKGKFTIIITLFLLWIDVLIMPYLDKLGVLELSSNWLIGEFLLIILVFIPSYLWAKFSFENKNTALRALFQVLVMSMFLLIVIPFSLKIFNEESISFDFSLLWFQVVFILALPSLIAVVDLLEKGSGTPFPYDKTKNLVRTGVYAYIKNPIQWSFTVLFIPLSVYHQSYFLLLGLVISILYTTGVSNNQENEDMKLRFGDLWTNYKKKIPSWYFLWKPIGIPKGVIYFKQNCNQCEGIKEWFENQKLNNLDIKYSNTYKGNKLMQVTYINHSGKEYKSVKAIANGLEHINLGYASLGWFLRFPLINFVIQTIVNVLGFSNENQKFKKT
ncbi:MAG: isoprenylcysteine carboxylmethyltransferase family protein [Polaribacter sp.]